MYHDYEDKRDTVLRMLHSLSTGQFRNVAKITFKPYINLKNDTTIIYGG